MASVPPKLTPLTLMALAVPTFLLSKSALRLMVKVSPATRLSVVVTVAVVVPSYTLFTPVKEAVSARGVISPSVPVKVLAAVPLPSVNT